MAIDTSTSSISSTSTSSSKMQQGRSKKIPRSLAACFLVSVVVVCMLQLPNLEYDARDMKPNGDLVFSTPFLRANNIQSPEMLPRIQIRIEAAAPSPNNSTHDHAQISNNGTLIFDSTHKKRARAEEERDEQQQKQDPPRTMNTNVNITTIQDYLKKAVKHPYFKRQLTIVSWDSNGVLDTNLIYQQCRFRNFVEAATHPYLLQTGNAKATPYNPHGVVALLATTDHIEMIDWDVPSPIPIIAWSAPIPVFYNRSWGYVVPTPFELSSKHGGGAAHSVKVARRAASKISSFQERIPILMYRGLRKMNPRQRGRVFELGQNTSNAHWLNATEKGLDILDMVPYRYLLDVGGISGTTWTALRWKMCSGALVFKVDSGRMDWWHAYLEPWKHYVPIREDVSDLKEKWEWAEAHPEEAYRIAQAGEQVCLSTLEPARMHEELQKVISSLPPATAELRAELGSLMQDSFDRLAKNETALLFSAGEKPNPQKDFVCPR